MHSHQHKFPLVFVILLTATSSSWKQFKKKSHSKVVVSGGATLLNLTIKSYCLAHILFPVCGLRNLMCSWQFFHLRYELTVRPFLTVLCHLKWANN